MREFQVKHYNIMTVLSWAMSVSKPEVEHVLSQLIDAFIWRLKSSIDDVNPVRLRVGDVLRHEAAESREIRGH